jgi:HEPN superfamily AbiU2-like protein
MGRGCTSSGPNSESCSARSQAADLMNETAPTFFGHLEDVLWNDVLLHLSRLTDPPATGGQQNLTFRRLPQLVARLPIRDAVHTALDRVEGATRFARDWRDRRLAHRDFRHAQDPTVRPLAPASRASVETALRAVRELMQIPEDHFRDTEVAYEQVINAPGGAWEMLYHLESGLDAIRARKAERIIWKPKYL